VEPSTDVEAVPSLLRFPQMKPSQQGLNWTKRTKTHMNTQHFWLSRNRCGPLLIINRHLANPSVGISQTLHMHTVVYWLFKFVPPGMRSRPLLCYVLTLLYVPSLSSIQRQCISNAHGLVSLLRPIHTPGSGRNSSVRTKRCLRDYPSYLRPVSALLWMLRNTSSRGQWLSCRKWPASTIASMASVEEMILFCVIWNRQNKVQKV
jgi:hypothetical protein